MSGQFFDRRGNEIDQDGNQIIRTPNSSPGNRAFGVSIVYKKKGALKTAAANGGSNPPNKPPKGPTGGKNPKRGSGEEEQQNQKRDAVIKKGKIKYDDRENPRTAFKEKK